MCGQTVSFNFLFVDEVAPPGDPVLTLLWLSAAEAFAQVLFLFVNFF